MTRALGRLVIAAEQLRHVALTTSVSPDTAGDDIARWTEFATHLLDLHQRILEEAAVKTFSGSAGEHLAVSGDEGILIPADADYLGVLSRRMDRHTRIGRLLSGDVQEREASIA